VKKKKPGRDATAENEGKGQTKREREIGARGKLERGSKKANEEESWGNGKGKTGTYEG